jgi:hypothetical protein
VAPLPQLERYVVVEGRSPRLHITLHRPHHITSMHVCVTHGCCVVRAGYRYVQAVRTRGSHTATEPGE